MPDINSVNEATTLAQIAKEYGLPPNSGWLGVVGSIPVVGLLLFRLFVRLKAKDMLELTKDRTETDIVKTMREELASTKSENERLKDRLDEVSDERNLAVQQLGRLGAEAEMNKAKAMELKPLLESMESKLTAQTSLLHDSLVENAQLKSKVSYLELMLATNSNANKGP